LRNASCGTPPCAAGTGLPAPCAHWPRSRRTSTQRPGGRCPAPATGSARSARTTATSRDEPAWFASVAVLDEGGYEIVRRDTTRREHDVTVQTSIGPIAGDLTRWLDRIRALTALTLAGGPASTAFAPLTATLADHLTWRATCLVLALIFAAVTIPLHAVFLRRP
jgi:hypothetical protein